MATAFPPYLFIFICLVNFLFLDITKLTLWLCQTLILGMFLVLTLRRTPGHLQRLNVKKSWWKGRLRPGLGAQGAVVPREAALTGGHARHPC